MMGDRPWEIVFEDVRVPVENRVGAEGDGFKLAQKWLGPGRVHHGARALGVAERCLEMATSLCQAARHLRPAARRTPGDPMDARRHASSSCEAARLLVYQAA